MKRILSILISLVLFITVISAQEQQEMVSKCALSIGENTIFMKDHIIKLPQANSPSNIPVHKASMALMKKQKYRFTLCNSEESTGELVLSLYDKGKLISSSAIGGKAYNSIDFTCNKTGIYTLWYTFNKGEKGNGVGIISLIR